MPLPDPEASSSLNELARLSASLRDTAEALCRSSEASETRAAHGAASAKVRAALAEAEAALRVLAADASVAPVVPKREVRVWMDGAFDMMHFGHVNAFRQGKALGTHLVVGVNSDASITAAKGAPIMNDAERTMMVRSCKFVDAVVENVPYVMDAAYVRHVLQVHRVDVIVHGDDPCIVDGKDVYESAKAVGRYRTIPRTEGVSTTDLVGRMLLLARRPHVCAEPFVERGAPPTPTRASDVVDAQAESRGRLLKRSRAFLSTSRMNYCFARGAKAPDAGAAVVYVAGAFDLFHAGHVAFLKAARGLGDYLVVGVHGDALVADRRGDAFPVMNMQERVLSVLGCRYVDDCLFDAPLHVSETMVQSFKIAVVAVGKRGPDDPDEARDADPASQSRSRAAEADPFAVPKRLGIFTTVDSASDLSSTKIADRIRDRHELLLARYHAKSKKEQEYYAARHGGANPPSPP